MSNSQKNLVIRVGLYTMFMVAALSITNFLQLFKLEDFLKVLEALVWPLTVLFIILSFRELTAYFMLSFNKYNLFGSSGEIQPPLTVIKELADELIDKEKRDKEFERLQNVQRTLTEHKEALNAEATKWRNFAMEQGLLLAKYQEAYDREENRKAQMKALESYTQKGGRKFSWEDLPSAK